MAAIALGGAPSEANGQAPPTPEPALRFESTSLQLGEIRSGVAADCQFAFVNAGTKRVEIVEARPGCGCLKPRLELRAFESGQHGIVPLGLQTLGQAAGPHTWHLTILYRDGAQLREQALQVTASVVTEVTVQPASLTLFTLGSASPVITLTDLRPQPLTILRLEMTSPYVRAEASAFAKNSLGNLTSKITIHINPELPPGRHEERLIIHTDDPVYREFQIPIILVKESGQ